jgi:hypothetical protein
MTRRILAGIFFAGIVLGIFPMAFAGDVNVPLDGGWSVGMIETKSDTGDKFCSMKANYQNGQMLVFARNNTGAHSLAVDFGQKILEAGRQYPLDLTVSSKAYPVLALAATKTVLILQLTDNQPLYAAINKTDHISFVLNAKPYHFSLDNVEAGFQAIDTCAKAVTANKNFASLIVPMALKKMPPPQDLPANKIALPAKTIQQTSPAPQISRQTIHSKEVDTVPTLATIARSQGLQDDISLLRAENRKLTLENQNLQGALIERELNSGDALNTLRAIGDATDGVWEEGLTLTEMAEAYMQPFIDKCQGDAAHSLGIIQEQGGGDSALQSLEGELVCLNSPKDSAIAFLFIADHGKFTVIKQSATPKKMAEALAKRESLEREIMFKK